MSYIFQIEGETVWNPGLRVGQLYVAVLEAVAGVLEKPSGLGPDLGELYEIEVPELAALVRKMLAWRTVSSHGQLWSLLDGVLPISIAVLERGGVSVTGQNERQREYLAEVHRMHIPMES